MKRDDLNQRLSQISTMWTVLQQAHAGSRAEVRAAQQLLLERYGGAVHRYLVRAVGDVHAADDLLQEFALALIQGSFRGADPERKRFRFYVKTVLFHMVSRHGRGQRKKVQPLPGNSPELANLAAPSPDNDQDFDDNWRDQLLARAWEHLNQSQPLFHDVLRFRVQHPKMESADMANQLSGLLGRPFTPQGVRQTLHRARENFAELLIDEVAQTLEEPNVQRLQGELADLSLLDYCRPALKRRSHPSREQ
jgi:RNA polymerase sigma factor (sigma-70 family)